MFQHHLGAKQKMEAQLSFRISITGSRTFGSRGFGDGSESVVSVAIVAGGTKYVDFASPALRLDVLASRPLRYLAELIIKNLPELNDNTRVLFTRGSGTPCLDSDPTLPAYSRGAIPAFVRLGSIKGSFGVIFKHPEGVVPHGKIIDFEGQRVHVLESSRAQALFLPEGGGRLMRFTVDAQEVVVWPPNSDFSIPAKVRGGNPLLFPVTARHMVDGVVGKCRYPGSDTVYDLPMHGFARTSAFRVIYHDSSMIRMLLEPNDETMAVKEKTDLTVELRTLNTGTSTMPYYAGHHFYFNVNHNERDRWTVDIPCNQWGFQTDSGDIEIRDKQRGPSSLSEAILIDNFHLELSGTMANLSNVDTKKTIELDLESPVKWYNVTTWAMSPEHDHYCVEPWLGLPNALHHGQGLRLLSPAREEAPVCTIRLRDSNSPQTPQNVSNAAVDLLSREDLSATYYRV